MQAPARPGNRVPEPRRRGGRALRVFGWALVAAGVVVLLYVVYALFYTGLETDRAQSELLDRWETEVGSPSIPDAPGNLVPDTADAAEAGAEVAAPEVGDAVAVIAFERPGSDTRPVSDDHLAVVEGVGAGELRAGPGHYPDSAAPGGDGNFAVAGHRVTYAAPFHRLDELRDGDEIHVWDRSGGHHVYRVSTTEIVRPTDGWVVGDDPLETGAPTITLTTCHPRYSNRQRMVAFGELVT